MGPVKKLERASVLIEDAMTELHAGGTPPSVIAQAMVPLGQIATAIDVEVTLTPWEVALSANGNGHSNGRRARKVAATV